MSTRPLQRPRPLYVTCDHGVEDLLATELKKLGADEVMTSHRGVHCMGHEMIIWRINLCSRLANRVLIPLTEFMATDKDSLYTQVKKIRWDWWITPQHTIAVDASSVDSQLQHTHFIAQVTKDAIVDAMRDRFQIRPNVDTQQADLPVNIHIIDNLCTVSLDSSGMRLHKRGYRTQAGEAPLKETLASFLNHRAQWRPHEAIVDLTCGSGTILIEAALRGCVKVLGQQRANQQGFAFQKWLSHAPHKFEQWLASIPTASPHPLYLWGSDRDGKQIQYAKNNAKNAEVEPICQWLKADLNNAAPQAAAWVKKVRPTTDTGRIGIVLMNPPYGVRLSQQEELRSFYYDLGQALKTYFVGYEAWILVAKQAPWKNIGLKVKQKIPIRNGKLDCWLLHYELYK